MAYERNYINGYATDTISNDVFGQKQNVLLEEYEDLIMHTKLFN